jgi:excisionase family DNA binding protein
METLLCIDELAGILKVTEQSIRKWIFKRQIPFVKIGKVIRFRPSRIDTWIDSGAMAALQENIAIEEIPAGELFAETETKNGDGE